MRGQLGNMMQMMQQVQENAKKMQDSLAVMEVTGSAGGGMVSVVMTGQHQVRSVKIDKEITGDIEMLEDLVTAACNDAVSKVAKETQERMASVTGGLNLPAGFKLPF